MHSSCAQETLHYIRILHVRRSLNSVQIQQKSATSDTQEHQVLGFHAIGIDCGDKDSSQIVCVAVWSWTFQILQIRILEFRFFQIRQLAVASDPHTSFNIAAFAYKLSLVHPGGLTVCRTNLRIGRHSTGVHNQKNFIELTENELSNLH